MASVKKEDARIEKLIRALLKLPGNRRCINCNLLGPQYVCTTFSTFVCTNCSGIHREFTHRVKSVSMAKFTSDEVEALQAGGNEKAKQIYFKLWDPMRNSFPDSNNILKLRDFIKRVYVDKRFAGETSSAELPRVRLSEKEEPNQSRSITTSFRIEPKSSDSGDRFERHSSERSSPSFRSEDNIVKVYFDDRRSPRYAQNYSRHANASHGRKPVKFEVVDDRFKDDEIRNRKLSNLESKLRQLQPSFQKNVEEPQSPVVRSVGEVLVGPSPKVGETSQACNREPHDVQQNKASNAAAEDNWAIFDDFNHSVNNAAETSNSNTWISSVTEKTPQATTYANSLDLLLFELSAPLTPTTGVMSEISTGDNNDPTPATVENASTSGDFQQFPSTPIRQTTPSPKNSYALSITPTLAIEMEQPSNAVHSHVDLFDEEDYSNEVSDGKKLSSLQFCPSVSVGSSYTTQQPITPITPAASKDTPSYVLNSHDSSNAFSEMSPQSTAIPAQDTKPDVAVETKYSGRKELPEDLFTSSYSPAPAAPLAGWQNVQPHDMGFGMQYYPNSVPSSAFPISAMSRNPFDETQGRTITHTSSLPAMTSLQSAPSASPRTGLMHASSFEALGMMPQSPSYGPPAVHSQSTFSSGFPSGAYYGQVNNNMQSPRPEGVSSFSNDRSTFGSLSTMQASGGGEYMTPTTPNSFSKKGGNPFGDD